MFVSLRILTLPRARAGDCAVVVEALRAVAPRLQGVLGCWIAPVSPVAVINAGDIVWRMVFRTEGEALGAALDPAWAAEVAPAIEGALSTHVGYRLTAPQVRREGAGVWRALIFGVMPGADPAHVRQMERTTLLLPKYVEEIRSWAFSPVLFSETPKTFHYVWEQEFDAVADLTGPYMTRPIHWGVADAFFDAEYPEYIVDPYLIQVVGEVGHSIIAEPKRTSRTS